MQECKSVSAACLCCSTQQPAVCPASCALSHVLPAGGQLGSQQLQTSTCCEPVALLSTQPPLQWPSCCLPPVALLYLCLVRWCIRCAHMLVQLPMSACWVLCPAMPAVILRALPGRTDTVRDSHATFHLHCRPTPSGVLLFGVWPWAGQYLVGSSQLCWLVEL
jgi:hypothetical protein